MRKRSFLSFHSFTLIELLTVITIILILMSLLLPALTQTRGYAYQTTCKDNLHQFGLAFELYTHDNNGNLPNFHWSQALNDYLGLKLNKDLDQPLIRCPATPPTWNNIPLRLTYSYNGAYWDNCVIWGKLLSEFADWEAYIKQNQIVRPEQLCLLTEYWPGHNPAQVWWGSEWWGLIVNDQRMRRIHFKKANFLFADGHVQALRVNTPIPYEEEQWAFDPIFCYDRKETSSRLD